MVRLLEMVKQEITSTASEDARATDQFVAAPDLLVLDDLDIGREGDWSLLHVAAALRRRTFRKTRATVLTSDCHPSKLGPVWE
jgi:hypothetical protein